MRTITLEEHFVTESFLRAIGGPRFADLQPKLGDLGAGRIADMDEAGIDLQVLSLASMGFDALDAATATALARDVNDEVAAAVRAHPARLAGFAALALKDANSAASELDRCVTRLGFPGALVDGDVAQRARVVIPAAMHPDRLIYGIGKQAFFPGMDRIEQTFSRKFAIFKNGEAAGVEREL